jgi:carbamoyltransferase
MVSIDGAGETQSTVIYDHNFNIIKSINWPKSIGTFYSHVTKRLDLIPLQDEYVVMGLSSYGEDKFSNVLCDLHNSWEDNIETHGIPLAESWIEPAAIKQLSIIDNLVLEHTKQDVAASVQEFARKEILNIMREARKYGSRLVYSGGVAQNVVINSLVADMFDSVHISIAPNDGGSALGCAARSWSQETGGDKLIWTPYLGHDMENDINPKEVVDHLLSEQYCGVASGKAEFGPRALGNRSLIADVRFDVKNTVNAIKKRQQFRPFGPAILEEYADDYFRGHKNEYMQYTCKALHDYSSVTHVDGTARVQVVKKDCTSVFRKIIEEFYERTGIPMLLNTSLNIRGRPIVNDKKDARLFENKYKCKVFYE